MYRYSLNQCVLIYIYVIPIELFEISHWEYNIILCIW